MNKKNKAFTLSELLVAMGIIGAIAAIAIPSLMNNMQKRALTTSLKNTYHTVKLLIEKEKLMNPSRSLGDSIFADAEKFLSTKNFNTLSICDSGDKSCWKTEDYRTINNTLTTSVKRPTNMRTAKLKNGAAIGFTPILHGGATSATFYIDVNGDDFPNIAGRDYFMFYIGTTGIHLHSVSPNVEGCKSGTVIHCFYVIADNGWKMPY